jgi:hypothetical protein
VFVESSESDRPMCDVEAASSKQGDVRRMLPHDDAQLMAIRDIAICDAAADGDGDGAMAGRACWCCCNPRGEMDGRWMMMDGFRVVVLSNKSATDKTFWTQWTVVWTVDWCMVYPICLGSDSAAQR